MNNFDKELQAAREIYEAAERAYVPLIDTGRKPIPLERFPKDLNFTETIGGTTYTVRSFFNPNAEESIIATICRMVMGDKNEK